MTVQVMEWNGDGWNLMPGRMWQISVGNARNIAGIAPDSSVWQWMPDQKKWKQLPGRHYYLSMGEDGNSLK
jgi:hypothetical protein